MEQEEPVASASEPENKRDEYQECSHVETVPQIRNDKMNEQAKGMTGCHTDKCRDRKRIVRGMAQDESNHWRYMKDNGDGKAQTETCATGHTGMTADTAHQT